MNATTAQMSYILAGRQLGFILGNALSILDLFTLHKMFLVFAGDHRNPLYRTRLPTFLDTCYQLKITQILDSNAWLFFVHLQCYTCLTYYYQAALCSGNAIPYSYLNESHDKDFKINI